MAKKEQMQGGVLLVDDDTEFLLSSSITLRAAGIEPVWTLSDSREAVSFLKKRDEIVVVLDLAMPHLSGDELLGKIMDMNPGIPVIIMTATDELSSAVDCMRVGAHDYLVKPVENSHFIAGVKSALKLLELRSEVTALKEHLLSDLPANEEMFSPIVTNSKKMRAIFKYVQAIAGSNQPVLITGETGVGKELVAQALHKASGSTGELVDVNIAGLDDTVFSDTLFGHEKGAFTGAEKARDGLIKRAAGGTLFLDEIGDMKEASQIKLLHLLQERRYYPLGSDVPRTTDARIIVATNRDLSKAMRDGTFRNDLYYRLRFHQIHIPSLRERPEDIPVLLDHFLDKAASSLSKKKPTPPQELVTLLSNYHFPGNIREMEGMIFDAVAKHESGVLSMDSFRHIIGDERSVLESSLVNSPSEDDEGVWPMDLTTRFPTLKEAEEYLVAEALRRCDQNQRIAAELLGITRQALNKRLIRERKR